MNKYLELPVKFLDVSAQEEMEKLEGLGIEYDEESLTYEGILYINPDHIVCFNEDSDQMLNLTLTDGYNHKIFMPFKEWLNLIKKND